MGFIRCALPAAAIAVVLAVAPPVDAQAIITGEIEGDRARLTGFVWRGNVNGTIDAPLPEPVGTFFDRGIDLQTDLGLNSGSTGWVVDADVGAGRHRLLFSFAGIGHSGTGSFDIPLGVDVAPVEVISATEISIRDVHGAYNFLIVREDWLDAGVIGGVGYFSNQVDLISNVVTVSEDFSSPYPMFGGNAVLKSEDLISIYFEWTGSPKVSVGDFSGWQSQLSVSFIVYPVPEIGFIAGYERYRLNLDDAGSGVGFDFIWDGYVVGGQFRF